MNINNTEYKLCLLDTNALTSFIQNPYKWISYFDHHFEIKNTLICYSIFSLCELWYRKEIFEQYLDVFSWYPSLVLDGHESIFQKELLNYFDQNEINPIVISPTTIYEKGLSKKAILQKLFLTEHFINRTHFWKDQENEILQSIIELKKNYPPNKGNYSIKEIEKFNYFVTIEQIGFRAPDFSKKIILSNQLLDIKRFPSINMTNYMVFYKFYPDNRKPLDSDIFDIIITAICPYVDCIITEGNVCNIINVIQKRHNFLNNCKAYSLKDINQKISII